MTQLRLRLFGTLSVEDSGRPLGAASGQPKRLALLALLACSGSTGISRERLLASLWGESDEAKGRNAMNQALHALRRDLLGDPVIERGSNLRLNSELVECDVVEFDRALGRGDLEDAVARYTGPFLDGIYLRETPGFEEWVEIERAKLLRSYRSALGGLAQRAEGAADLSARARWLRLLVDSDPHDSTIVRQLIECLVSAGDRTAARRVGEEYCQAVARDLEAKPDAALAALTERLKSHNSPTSPSLASLQDTTRSDGDEAVATPPFITGSRIRGLWWAIGVATLAMLATVVVLFRSVGPLSPTRVLLVVTGPATSDSLLRAASTAIQDWLLMSLSQTRRLEPVLETVRSTTSPSTADGSNWGRKANAGNVITLDIGRTTDSLWASATIVDANRRRILGVARTGISLSSSELGVLAEELRQRVMGLLASQLDPELFRWAESGSRPTTWKAYQLFAAGRDAYVVSSDPASIEQFRQAVELDSAFMVPRVWMMFAYLGNAANRWSTPDSLLKAADSIRAGLASIRQTLPPAERALLEMAEGLLDNEPDKAYEAAQKVARTVPRSEWNYWVAQSALEAGYPNAALRWLAALPSDASWRIARGGAEYWGMRLHIGMDARDYTGLIADADTLSRIPGLDGNAPMYRALGLAGLGRAEETLALTRDVASGRLHSEPFTVDDIARLTAPLLQFAGRQDIVLQTLAIADSFQVANGHPAAFRAPLWYWRRDWVHAREFYDSAAAMIPQYARKHNWRIVATVQGRRGGLAARVGDTVTARALEDWLARIPDSLGLHPRGRRDILVGISRIEAMLGQPGSALKLLRAAGTYNYFPPLWFDSEFESLRGNPEYERLMRPRDGPPVGKGQSIAREPTSLPH